MAAMSSQADAKAAIAAVWESEPEKLPEQVSIDGWPFDLWKVGTTLLALPAVPPGRRVPASLKRLIRDRRRATLSGICPRCDACAEVTTDRISFSHEPWCSIGDPGFSETLGRHVATGSTK